MHRRLIPAACCAVLLAATLARAEPPADGTLLDASVVAPDDDVVAKLEAALPDIRSVLERTEIRSITYASDGLKVEGYLVVPKEGERLPCVIFNRGGNREFGALTDVSAAARLAPIASWGYVVVASQYRGNAGGEGTEEFGGRDVDDVLSLLPLLESVPRADTGRVGMFGWSRGGMMTYLALARTDRVAAAVVGGGVTDLADTLERRPGMEGVFADLIPDYATDKAAALAARSAVRWPERLPEKTPVLMLHGGADWRVDPHQALSMASALLDVRRPFRLVMFEGGDHGLSEYRAEVDRLVRDWLDRYVRDRKPWPSVAPHGR